MLKAVGDAQASIGDDKEIEEDATSEGTEHCAERWKAASPDSNKRMFSLFSISGIFVAVCCHGHVLVACDMIRSGEL